MADVRSALHRLTSALPAGEDRDGQIAMAEAVARAITTGRHLVVQAGTGTGKTIGYLVPGIVKGKKLVVATATKALQDQLATKDLPFVERHLGQAFSWAILKGRSNYVCLQRLREVQTAGGDVGEQGTFELGDLPEPIRQEVQRIAEWAATSTTGDGADMGWAPSDRAWQAVSVSSDECPGATRCPMGAACFSELARSRAMAADVVVVNTHLYGLNVASHGALLPDHDVLVVDEAHQLEDIMSDTVGMSLGGGRLLHCAAIVRRILDDPQAVSGIVDGAAALTSALAPWIGKRVPHPLPDDLTDVLTSVRLRLSEVLGALGRIETGVEEAQQKRLRAQILATRLATAMDGALGEPEGSVAFVSGTPGSPLLEIKPLDVGPTMSAGVWGNVTGILTSATIPSSLPTRVGLPPGRLDVLDVGSPFDYQNQAMLYCALHLPDPRSAEFVAATHDELAALITAAGGRTLALFTSWRAMEDAAAEVRMRVPFRILTQRELPKPALVAAFAGDESTCLFATTGLFQGIDVPGRTLSLVVIDKLPFARPDDPLLSARRELLGASAFATIDVPRAATLLAQATGRLIRTTTDRGVVAVLDRRLGTASYRWDIVRALPPMRRTRRREEAAAFLHAITVAA